MQVRGRPALADRGVDLRSCPASPDDAMARGQRLPRSSHHGTSASGRQGVSRYLESKRTFERICDRSCLQPTQVSVRAVGWYRRCWTRFLPGQDGRRDRTAPVSVTRLVIRRFTYGNIVYSCSFLFAIGSILYVDTDHPLVVWTRTSLPSIPFPSNTL